MRRPNARQPLAVAPAPSPPAQLWHHARLAAAPPTNGTLGTAHAPEQPLAVGASQLTHEQLRQGAELLLQHGPAALLAMVLAAVPGLAAQQDELGWRPLHLAAFEGATAAVEVLLTVAPAVAAARDKAGRTPLHLAACRGDVRVMSLLLGAAPQAASMADTTCGWTPLHQAAYLSHVAAVQLLLTAAPEAAMAEDKMRRTPLHLSLALGGVPSAAAVTRALLACGPPEKRLVTLQAAGAAGLPFFPDLVTPNLPMPHEWWARVPPACTGLGRALPAALAHSPAQARALVARLPQEEVQRLRTFALCLNRTQRRHRVYLPPPLVGQVLSLFDA